MGGITAIQEKDLGKGLLAGIGGLAAGALGEKLGNLFGMGADPVTQTAIEGGADTAKAVTSAVPDATTELAQTAIQNPDVFPVSAAKATRGFGFGEGTGLGTVPDLAPAPAADATGGTT